MTTRNGGSSGWLMRDYRMKLRLGWGAPERRLPQAVRFDVELRFLTPPRACASDDLVDTVCYDEAAKCLAKLAAREFRLLEHLAQAAYDAIRALVPPRLGRRVQLRVEATKLKPPVLGLRGDVRFFRSDWI